VFLRSPDPRGAASLTLVLASVVVVAGCREPRRAPAAASAPAPTLPAGARASAPPAQAGLRVYRDPATGAFVEPPPTAPGPSLRAPSGAPLTFVETAAPGGGTMVNVGGALRMDVTARVGAHGAEASCGPAAR
jgi:hypothetical protein